MKKIIGTKFPEFNVTQTFLRFLKDKGVYNEFVYALHHVSPMCEGHLLDELEKVKYFEKHPSAIVVHADFPLSALKTCKTDKLLFLLYNKPKNRRENLLRTIIVRNIQWGNTLEGFDYWANINSDWNHYLSRLYWGETANCIRNNHSKPSKYYKLVNKIIFNRNEITDKIKNNIPKCIFFLFLGLLWLFAFALAMHWI